MAYDGEGGGFEPAGPGAPQNNDAQSESDLKTKANVALLIRTIKADKQHHEKAYKRMRRDMQVAMHGYEKAWGAERYSANISGRHIKQRAAALYAKNPRVVAKRREQLDFAVWDENPASLQLAIQTIQTGQMAAAQAQAAGPQLDPATGMALPAVPEMPPGFEQAMAVMADFQQGTARRTQIAKIGKTLEILFSNAMIEQKPLVFKTGMKQTVRRACTTGVGYVEVGFQRQMGLRPGLSEQLADSRTRLDHLKTLVEQVGEGEIEQDDAEMAALELSLAALQAEPEIVLREGLIFDYPQSTKVIPSKRCKALVGFVGAPHVTVEYIYTVQEVREMFGVDLSNGGYTSYAMDPGSSREMSANDVMDDDYSWAPVENKKDGLVCVWKMYDKPSGLVYYLADGHDDYLREPAAPEVFVEDFWPIYALTFNAVESEDELFPPSDIALLIHMQRDYNRAREGKREHREAARPRWVAANGSFSSEDDPLVIKNLKAFELGMVNMDPTQKIGDILQVVPVPGVDPNLYDTGETFTDVQLVAGAQEAQFGGTSSSTATESAIAANSTASSDSSSIDDLDAFLTVIARAGGQILQKEMHEEQVKMIVGPGAVWPEMSLADIAGEIYLEVAAGSTGKPNQAVEVNNWQQLAPILMQIPGISPTWLGKETIRRLDDKLDLTEALTEGIPSIVAQNGMAQAAPPPGAAADGNDPAAQGGKGTANAPAAPKGEGGSDAAFGTNQTGAI